jgi:hypothetical protein
LIISIFTGSSFCKRRNDSGFQRSIYLKRGIHLEWWEKMAKISPELRKSPHGWKWSMRSGDAPPIFIV